MPVWRWGRLEENKHSAPDHGYVEIDQTSQDTLVLDKVQHGFRQMSPSPCRCNPMERALLFLYEGNTHADKEAFLGHGGKLKSGEK